MRASSQMEAMVQASAGRALLGAVLVAQRGLGFFGRTKHFIGS